MPASGRPVADDAGEARVVAAVHPGVVEQARRLAALELGPVAARAGLAEDLGHVPPLRRLCRRQLCPHARSPAARAAAVTCPTAPSRSIA